MLSVHAIRVFNIALRGLTLVSKFVLLFFLAKLLSPNDVGLYGLLAATIGYALYVLGLEFYNFATREMIGVDQHHWLGMIRDQVVLYALLYLMLLPISLTIFANDWLPWEYAAWFYVLLFLEHMAQELNRILIAMSEQLLASVVLFVRSGAWCLVSVALMSWQPQYRTLSFCLATWIAGALIACVIGIRKLGAYDKASLRKAINWRWIRRGIRVALPLLIASLAMRGVFTFDRYLVEGIAGLNVLGPYVLFVGIATAVLSFLDAGVVVFSYPKLVADAKLADKYAFKSGMRNLAFNVVGVTVTLILTCLIFVEPLLGWLKNDVYVEQLYLLYWLLLAIAIYAVSLIPHLGLYACGHDRPLLHSQFVAFVLFLIIAYFGAQVYGIVAIPCAMCVAFSVMLLWKTLAYRRLEYIQWAY